MPTRRRFLSALASLCAAAGLSRLAGGAAASEPVKPVAVSGKGLTITRTAIVRAFEPSPGVPKLGEKFTGVLHVQTHAIEFRHGKWQPSRWRVVRFENGCVVEVSRELPEA